MTHSAVKPKVKIVATGTGVTVTIIAKPSIKPAKQYFEFGLLGSDLADILAICGIRTEYTYKG